MIPASRHAPERERHAVALAQVTARRWFGRGSVVSDDDILGAALLGAAKALRLFDPTRGVQFASYAITVIKAEIQEELRRWDHLRRGTRERARVEERETGEWPEWAAPPLHLGDVVLRDAIGEYGFSDLERGDTLADQGVDPEALALARIAREGWLSRLSARERRLIERCYYEGELVQHLAPEFGVCKARVHQLHRQALTRLRAWVEEGLVSL